MEQLEKIVAKVGVSFEITSSVYHPTAGYGMKISYNKKLIRIVQWRAKQGESFGAGRQETLKFMPLFTGNTQIHLTYKRPWEKEAVREEEYSVEIQKQ